ncbi:dipeptidase [Mycobacteroides chelonae]|nr:dipeptidase [Mycobacteroides chelonae]
MSRAQSLVRDREIIDLHTHPQKVAPHFVRRVAEWAADIPRDPLSNLRQGQVDIAVVTAVGDPLGTLWRGRGPWRGVEQQLNAARTEGRAAGMSIIGEPPIAANVAVGGQRPPTAIILGVEGADFIGDSPDRLRQAQRDGVRVLGLVHYADNLIGTIGTSIFGRRGSKATITGRRQAGLTAYGADLIRELNNAGVVIDLAHADTATTIAACEASSAPVISSHTAASSIRDFPRYITDEAIQAIAATGGVVGLWPVRLRNLAMSDLSDFARHASHIANLVGAQHIGIGTDKNGVSDYADGYSNSTDIANLAAALIDVGFTDDETANIMGGNARRVLDCTAASPGAD